jgi:putative hydrolase of the HAD superfamily
MEKMVILKNFLNSIKFKRIVRKEVRIMEKIFLFDLDNTLYTPDRGILKIIDSRIRQFMKDNYGFKSEEQIYEQRKRYYKAYGSTMLGLMEDYNLDPICYLKYIHDIDEKLLPTLDEKLYEILSEIDGKIILLTNSYKKYAIKILTNLGVIDLFDGFYDVIDMKYLNKNHIKVYQEFLQKSGFKAQNCIMHDDVWDFLKIPQQLGMVTVLVNHEKCEGNPDFQIDTIYELPKIIRQLYNS